MQMLEEAHLDSYLNDDENQEGLQRHQEKRLTHEPVIKNHLNLVIFILISIFNVIFKRCGIVRRSDSQGYNLTVYIPLAHDLPS